MTQAVFSYPANDADTYLSWFDGSFSSVFVATNPFLRIPEVSQGEWRPEEFATFAKQHGSQIGVSWTEVAALCGFSSIAHDNRALRLTGSKRIVGELACSSDTENMLNICKDQNIIVPDEGCYSPLTELALSRFLKQLGHGEVIAADHFGTSPRLIQSKGFALPGGYAPPEIHAQDRSVYVSIYTDYHYFLVCQTEHSLSVANPMDYFEGFFAGESTNDLWGVGNISDSLKP